MSGTHIIATASFQRVGRIGNIVSTLRSSISRDPVERYGARHYAAAEIANLLGGFRLYNKGLYWVEDQDFLDDWSRFPESDGLIKDRRYVLWSLARSTAGLPGHTAECGVYNGSSSWLICRAEEREPLWRHHMFDSFEGLSEPMDVDRPTGDQTFRWKKHDLAVGLERVSRNMGEFRDRVDFHPGWIPERFDEVSDQSFSFVHVDVDLYQPTLDSLKWFYPRMVPGGVLLCDDYGYKSCPGAYQAFNEFISEQPESTVIHLTTGQGLIVKR